MVNTATSNHEGLFLNSSILAEHEFNDSGISVKQMRVS
jgi:hypothetical protein